MNDQELDDLHARTPSAVLRRLIEEVRQERSDGTPSGYNRTHNRHNRTGPSAPAPRPKPPEDEAR